MRGLLWAERYFPAEWFSQAHFDDDEKYFEVASMTGKRWERVLWLGCRVAAPGAACGASDAIGLTYDAANRQFGVLPRHDVDVDVDMDIVYKLEPDVKLEPEMEELEPDEPDVESDAETVVCG